MKYVAFGRSGEGNSSFNIFNSTRLKNIVIGLN